MTLPIPKTDSSVAVTPQNLLITLPAPGTPGNPVSQSVEDIMRTLFTSARQNKLDGIQARAQVNPDDAALGAQIDRIVGGQGWRTGHGTADFPALPEDGEDYTLMGRDNLGSGAGNDPIQFWGRPNFVPNTPGTSTAIGHVLQVFGENDKDYRWAALDVAGAVAAYLRDNPITGNQEQRVLIDVPASAATRNKIIEEDSQLYTTVDRVVHEGTAKQATYENVRFDLGYFSDESALDANFYVVGRFYYNYSKYTPRVVAYVSGNSGPKHWVDGNAADLVANITADVGHFASDAEATPHINAVGNVYYNERQRRYRRAATFTAGSGAVTAPQRLRQANEDDVARIDGELRDSIGLVLSVSPQHIDKSILPTIFTLTLRSRVRHFTGATKVRIRFLDDPADTTSDQTWIEFPFSITTNLQAFALVLSPTQAARLQQLVPGTRASITLEVRSAEDDILGDTGVSLEVFDGLKVRNRRVIDAVADLEDRAADLRQITAPLWSTASGTGVGISLTTALVGDPTSLSFQPQVAIPADAEAGDPIIIYMAIPTGSNLSDWRVNLAGFAEYSAHSFGEVATDGGNTIYAFTTAVGNDSGGFASGTAPGATLTLQSHGSAYHTAYSGELEGRALAQVREEAAPPARSQNIQRAVDGSDVAGVASITLPADYATYRTLSVTLWRTSVDRVDPLEIATKFLAAQTANRSIYTDDAVIGWNPSTRVLSTPNQRIIYAELHDGAAAPAGGGSAFIPTKNNLYQAVKAIFHPSTNAGVTADDANNELDVTGGTGGGETNLLIDNPASPIAAAAGNLGKILNRAGRLFRNQPVHYADPSATYRDFAASDLPAGFSWGGALRISPDPNTVPDNRVIYTTAGGEFERKITTGGVAFWVIYNVPNWRGAAADNSDADSKVRAVGDVVFFDGKVQVAETYTARNPDRFQWRPLTALWADSENTDAIPPPKLGTGSRTGAKFLRDDGTWQAPPGGSGAAATLSQQQQIGLLKYSSSPPSKQFAHPNELTGTLTMSIDNPDLLTGDIWYVRKINESPINSGARTKWTSTTFSIDFPIPNTATFRNQMADGFNSVGSALELEFYDAATGGNGLGRIRSYVGGAQALRPAALATRALYDGISTKLDSRVYYWPDHQVDGARVPGGIAVGGNILARNERLTAAQVEQLLRKAPTAFTTLPDAGTLSWDVDDAGTLAQVTLGGAPRNFQPLVNATVGDELILRIVQDATGGRVISWHGDYKFVGGAAPLEPAANAVTYLRMVVIAADVVVVGYLQPGGGGGLNQSQVDARIAAIRSIISRQATPAAADRFYFTDENITGDPLSYATFRTLKAAINRPRAITAVAGAANTWSYTINSDETEVWVGALGGGDPENFSSSPADILFGSWWPLGLFSSSGRIISIAHRNPNTNSDDDSQSLGATASISGNTLTLVNTGWRNQGVAPIVYGR